MHDRTPASRALFTSALLGWSAACVLVPVLLAGCREDGPKPKPPAPVVSRPSAPTPPADGAAAQGGAASAPSAGASRAPAGAGAAATSPPGGSVERLSGPTDDLSRVEIAGLVMPKPVTWTWQKPSMQFRTLQFAVPSPGGASPDAELIFSRFAAGDGGPIEPNIDRWIGQFRSADGSPAAPTQRATKEIDGMRVTRIDLRGSYMGMGAAAPRPNVAQLGVIIEAPDATLYIRLLGPEATVESARASFDAMIDGLRRATSAPASE